MIPCSYTFRIVALLVAMVLLAPANALAQDNSVTDGYDGPVARNSSPQMSGVVSVPSNSSGTLFNDNLLQSQSIPFAATTGAATNVGAEAEATNNPSASCTFGSPDNDGDNSVWWWFTPSSNGSVTIDLDGSDFDTIVTILDGAVNEVACNDDDPGNPAGDFTSRIEDFAVTAGSPYFVRITGYQGDEGNYTFSFTGPVTGPPNDEIALRVTQDFATYPGDNRGATGPTGSETAASCSTDGNNSVWRFFNAPFDGTLTVDLSGSTFDTILTIMDDTRGGELACDDDGGDGLTSRVENVPMANGVLYYIRVTGFLGAEGIINYNVSFENPTAIEPDPNGLPGTHNLSSVYPNPFNPQARFTLEIAEQQNVRLAVYDALGREVATLFNGSLTAGIAHEFDIDGAGLPSGVYMVRATGEQFTDVRQVTLLK